MCIGKNTKIKFLKNFMRQIGNKEYFLSKTFSWLRNIFDGKKKIDKKDNVFY